MTELQSIKYQRALDIVGSLPSNDVLSDDIIMDLNENKSKLRSYQASLRQKSETLQKLDADALPMITEGKSIEDEIDDVSELK